MANKTDNDILQLSVARAHVYCSEHPASDDAQDFQYCLGYFINNDNEWMTKEPVAGAVIAASLLAFSVVYLLIKHVRHQQKVLRK